MHFLNRIKLLFGLSLVQSHMLRKITRIFLKTVGIVIAASSVRTKASHIAVQCRSCRNVISNIKVKPGLEGYAMPRKCNSVYVFNNIKKQKNLVRKSFSQ